MSRLKLILIIVLLSIIPNIKAIEYYIDNYDINMIVNEDNTFDITETITVYFNVDKHGILRIIPLENEITRLDGTFSYNKAIINDISVNDNYTLIKENSNLKIKIGSANKTFTGEKTYIIKYNYNIGKDPLDDIDELYYNLIGTDWDTYINNTTFTIVMPKEFDSSKLGFSAGQKGSATNNNVLYEVNGNVITGKYTEVLNSNNALTIRLELPEGYFVNTSNYDNYNSSNKQNTNLYFYILPVILLIIVVILYLNNKQNSFVIETAEFYPPKEYDSLEFAFLYNGEATRDDVVTLLIYLANKGYIKIEDYADDKYKIIKLKEYDGNNINQKIFFDGLFRRTITDNTILNLNSNIENDSVNITTSEDLEYNFYNTIIKIKENINTKENINNVFNKKKKWKREIIKKLTMLSIIILPIILFINNLDLNLYYEIYSFYTVLICLHLILICVVSLISNLYKSKIINNEFTTGFTITLMFFLFCVIILNLITEHKKILTYLNALNSLSIIGYIISLIMVSVMVYMLIKYNIRTDENNKILGQILGFKNFIEIAEKDKLEALVEKEPTYFYDILPYTYVLGLSDKWIKKFEKIAINKTDWYDGNSRIDTMVSSFNSSLTLSYSSSGGSDFGDSGSSSSSSSGGSSGGGSSGGGSGGGGGSSW